MERIDLSYDGKPVLSIDTGISISENPSIHFSFIPKNPGILKSHVTDSENMVFEREWQITDEGAS
jgi:sulfur-oxidizing protein SoxY